jgi:hypothetical protein
MANTLILVGNSIELNRNLSSGDAGVLGPFTIQATHNGASASASFNLAVAGAGGAVGPIPLPSPYPLQPGFTPISDVSQITGPGNYQLTANVQSAPISASNVILDGAGFSVAQNLSTVGQNVTIKNCHLNGGVVIDARSSSITLTNNWVVSTVPFTVYASNVTVSNNLLDGVNAAITDDLILTNSGSSQTLSNLKFLNNIVQNTFDVGFEGLGGWTQCTFANNYFTSVNWAVGGAYGPTHNNDFTTTYCTFENNIVHQSGSYGNNIFIFNGVTVNDDTTATSLWGGNGTSFVNNNTFTENIRQ